MTVDDLSDLRVVKLCTAFQFRRDTTHVLELIDLTLCINARVPAQHLNFDRMVHLTEGLYAQFLRIATADAAKLFASLGRLLGPRYWPQRLLWRWRRRYALGGLEGLINILMDVGGY